MIDEDVAYLQAVQSPRPGTQQETSVVTNGYGPKYSSYNTHKNKDNHQSGRTVNGTQNQVIQVTVHSGTDQRDSPPGRRSPIRVRSPVVSRQELVVLNGSLLTGIVIKINVEMFWCLNLYKAIKFLEREPENIKMSCINIPLTINPFT